MKSYELLGAAALHHPVSPPRNTTAGEISMSLFISVGALRLVKAIEQMINSLRTPQKG